jgi:RNA polymerase sigma factor (sigma-70 family)
MTHDLFVKILDESRPWIRNLAKGKNIPDPDDFTQEVCIKAFRGFRTFKGKSEGELRAWIGAICQNYVCDVFRKMRRPSSQATLRLDDLALAYIQDEDAEDGFEAVEDRNVLDRAMASLNEEMRNILSMRLDGAPWSEIASLTDLGVNAVKQQYLVAIVKVKAAIEEGNQG